jgi:hypothetical protein
MEGKMQMEDSYEEIWRRDGRNVMNVTLLNVRAGVRAL